MSSIEVMGASDVSLWMINTDFMVEPSRVSTPKKFLLHDAMYCILDHGVFVFVDQRQETTIVISRCEMWTL